MTRLTILFFSFLFFLPKNATSQIEQFQGHWKHIGTTYDFEFDLYIRHTDGNEVEGVFNWQVVNYDENDEQSVKYYSEKIGSWAKEFVRGRYDPPTQTFYLKGYKKEDPHFIISLDDYILRVNGDDTFEGETNSHGTWEGRINGKRLRGDSA